MNSIQDLVMGKQVRVFFLVILFVFAECGYAVKDLCGKVRDLVDQELGYAIKSADFRTNRDLFFAAEQMPVEFLKDLSSTRVNQQIFDAGCGVARIGAEFVFLRYVKEVKVPEYGARWQNYNLPEVYTRDAHKHLSPGGSLSPGPDLGKTLLVFLDRHGNEVHVPKDWYKPEKIAALKNIFTKPLANRARYLGVTFNLLDTPPDTYDQFLSTENDVPLPDPKQAKNWTGEVRGEMQMSGGKMRVITSAFEVVPQVELGSNRIVIDIEGILSYATTNFSQVLQRYLDVTSVNGSIWWKSMALNEKEPGTSVWIGKSGGTFGHDEWEDLYWNHQKPPSSISLKSWLAKIPGIEVSTYNGYPSVVSIKKISARVSVPELSLKFSSGNVRQVRPPFRLYAP